MANPERPLRLLLVAVEDSQHSEKAFQWTLDNLYRPGDEIHLVHIIPRLQFAAAYGVPPVDFVPVVDNSQYEDVIKQAEAFIIERFVKQLPRDFGSSPVVHIIKSEIDTESVGQVLCKKAEELNVACVVMASHNKGKLAEFFLGSVTNFCTHRCKQPVVVVH